jgi:hypothetical protein
MRQLPSLVVDVASLPNRLLDKFEFDICLGKPTLSGGISTSYFRVSLENLFATLRDNGSLETLILNENGVEIPVCIDQALILSEKIIRKRDSNENVRLKSSMHFIFPFFEPNPTETAQRTIMNLSKSLKTEASGVGIRSMRRMLAEILQRFEHWNVRSTTYRAPIVSLCQSSGFGKTKLSIELTKRIPGGYLVFREPGQSGCPRMNLISTELKILIESQSDSVQDQSELDYQSSNIGKILGFIANYICMFIDLTRENFRLQMTQQGTAASIAFKECLKQFGSLFCENLSESFIMKSPEQMSEIFSYFTDEFYTERTSSRITVENVAKFIEMVLSNPEKYYFFSGNMDSEYFRLLKEALKLFPFVLVVDEADLLIKHEVFISTSSNRINGLEIFRRALSYLHPTTRLVILTLGTRASIITLNPPLFDISGRYITRNTLPYPIILSSNTNVYSDRFPIYKMVPTFSLIKNPLMFKFLASLGRPLWTSYPFEQIVDFAAENKLINGNTPPNKFLLAVWMIRTGLMANPVSTTASSLVAGHMATLFAASSDLKESVISYPSEPILALASRYLTNSLGRDQNDALFTALKEYLGCVQINNGKYSEVMASMIILLIVDSLPNVANFAADYMTNLNHIRRDLSAFSELWIIPSFLNQTSGENIIPEISNFTTYTVHTLGSFLNKWISREESNLSVESLNLPSRILSGIINITHFVPLTRDNRGFSCGAASVNIPPLNLPVASNRVVDKSRNIIDRSLLQIGLSRQCGFMMPDNYYGYDYIIPVCLESDVYSFVGVQVKRADANLKEDIFKMQARLHYVQCPLHVAGHTCDTSDAGLSEIFGNQVSLLISLDKEGTFSSFKSSTSFVPDFSTASGNLNRLRAALTGDLPASLNLTRKKTAETFAPILHDKKRICDDLLLSTSIWDDSGVAFDPEDEFVPDNHIHRQFCFVSRGWRMLKNLIALNNSSANVANEILSSVSGPFKRSGTSSEASTDTIRNVVYDIGPTYMEYSDEIVAARTRGATINSNILDQAIGRLEPPSLKNIPTAPVPEQTDRTNTTSIRRSTSSSKRSASQIQGG